MRDRASISTWSEFRIWKYCTIYRRKLYYFKLVQQGLLFLWFFVAYVQQGLCGSAFLLELAGFRTMGKFPKVHILGTSTTLDYYPFTLIGNLDQIGCYEDKYWTKFTLYGTLLLL